MASNSIINLGKTLKKWFFILKNDQEALVQTRQLSLAVVVCLVVFYGVFSLIIEPKQKALSQKTAQKKTIEFQAPNQASLELATNIQVLNAQTKSLEESISILKLKEQLLREHWEILSDPDRFARSIFTLAGDSPLDISRGLRQMTKVEPRVQNNFAVHPLALTGETSFTVLFSYLLYLESRPEVGTIDNLVIEAMPAKAKYQNAQVKFSLLVGRISLGGAETKL